MSDHADSREFTLKKPLKQGDGFLKTITLSEPLAMHMEAAEKLATAEGKGTMTLNGMIIHLMALSSGQNPQTIRQLSARDFMEMRGYLNSFLDGSLPTGES